MTQQIIIKTSPASVFAHGMYKYFTILAGNKEVAVTKFDGKTSYVNVIVKNAAHRAFKGTGKDFKTVEAAIASYKDQTIKSMLTAILN